MATKSRQSFRVQGLWFKEAQVFESRIRGADIGKAGVHYLALGAAWHHASGGSTSTCRVLNQDSVLKNKFHTHRPWESRLVGIQQDRWCILMLQAVRSMDFRSGRAPTRSTCRTPTICSFK